MAGQSQTITWTYGRIAGCAMIVVAVVALAALTWKLASVLLLVFAGILAAIFVRVLARWTARITHLPIRAAQVIVLLLLAAIGGGTVYLAGHAIAMQMTELVDQLGRSVDKLRHVLSQYAWGDWVIEQASFSADDIPVTGQEVAVYASGAVSSLGSAVAAVVIVLVLAIYLALDAMTYLKGFVRLLPPHRRSRVHDVLIEVRESLEWWLLGKIASMFLVGVLTGFGLYLLGVPLPLALAVLAALLTFIPNFGPILSAIPAVLLGFIDSPMTALYVAVLYLAIQAVESYIFLPLIQQKAVDLPPALTILAQVAMGILFGAIGVIVATPLTVAGIVLTKRLYVEDALERKAG